MSTKQTPKSCGCAQCRRANHSPAGHKSLHKAEKGHRQGVGSQLTPFRNQDVSRASEKLEEVDVVLAPRGGRNG